MIWILTFVLLAASTAQADVVRKTKTTMQGFGANEGTATHYVTSDKAANESTMKWTRGFMKTMSGGKPIDSKEIIRLDKEVVWTIDAKKKTYREMTFAEFREMLKKGMEEADQQDEELPDTTGEDMYTWTVTDKSDPNPKVVNGWNCRNAYAEATGVNKSDSLDKVIITLNMWNSEEVPGKAEIAEFYSKYLKALGLDQLAAMNPGLLQATLLYQKQFNDLYETVKKAPGESVQSLIEIKRYQPKGKSLKKAVAEGAQSEIMGKIPFGKKKQPKDEPPVWEWKVKFSSTSELTEAGVAPIDAGSFEVPAGFKKKDK